MQSDAEKPVIIVDTKGEGRSSAPLGFDRGYVTVTPELRFEVSRRIKEEFENGRDYYALHGRRVHVPDKPTARPDPAALIWHNENRYLG